MEQKELTLEEKEAISRAKEELKNYRFNIKYIEEKLNDLEEVKELVLKTTPTLSPTGGTNSGFTKDKIGDSIARIEVLKNLCDDKIKELVLKKFEIDDKIESLEPPYRDILFYRYTRAKQWEDIAELVGFSLRHLTRLHGEALYLYSKIKDVRLCP